MKVYKLLINGSLTYVSVYGRINYTKNREGYKMNKQTEELVNKVLRHWQHLGYTHFSDRTWNFLQESKQTEFKFDGTVTTNMRVHYPHINNLIYDIEIVEKNDTVTIYLYNSHYHYGSFNDTVTIKDGKIVEEKTSGNFRSIE
jgi:hypothetical protein